MHCVSARCQDPVYFSKAVLFVPRVLQYARTDNHIECILVKG